MSDAGHQGDGSVHILLWVEGSAGQTRGSAQAHTPHIRIAQGPLRIPESSHGTGGGRRAYKSQDRAETDERDGAERHTQETAVQILQGEGGPCGTQSPAQGLPCRTASAEMRHRRHTDIGGRQMVLFFADHRHVQRGNHHLHHFGQT